jgi:hypothetical protein
MFSGQPEDLIKKFAPILLFDKSEQNLPSSTDWYSQQVGYQSGSTYYEPGTWSWSNPPSQATDYLVPPESVASQIEPGNVDTFVSYVHLLPVTGHSDEVDIQFWFFYPFNGTVTFDIDAMLGDVHGAMPLSQHWADWECVIVRVNTQQQVIAVFFCRQ